MRQPASPVATHTPGLTPAPWQCRRGRGMSGTVCAAQPPPAAHARRRAEQSARHRSL